MLNIAGDEPATGFILGQDLNAVNNNYDSRHHNTQSDQYDKQPKDLGTKRVRDDSKHYP